MCDTLKPSLHFDEERATSNFAQTCVLLAVM